MSRRVGRTWSGVLYGVLLISAQACSSPDEAPSGPDEPGGIALLADLSKGQRMEPRHWDAFAEGVALAMADEDVRIAVRDAMRASRLTEHKLEFPGFLDQTAGTLLAQRVAQRARISVDALSAALRRSDQIDFYLPAREHRKSWRATTELVVATNLRATPPATAVGPDGTRRPINLREAPVPGPAILMLQFAEPKGERLVTQRQAAGLVIQDDDDGEISVHRGVMPEVLPGNVPASPEAIARIQSRTRDQICQPETCGGGGGGGSPVVTRLTQLETEDICDNNNCSEGNEFEFHSVGTFSGSNTLRIEGVPSTTFQQRNEILIFTHPGVVGQINVSVKETDFSSSDDVWSYVTYNPNFIGAIPFNVDDVGTFWELKENPQDLDFGDPDRLAVMFEIY